MKARELITDHLRDFSLYEANRTLAYELGMTDGSRHRKGVLLTPGDRRRRAENLPGWLDGFNRAIELERK